MAGNDGYEMFEEEVRGREGPEGLRSRRRLSRQERVTKTAKGLPEAVVKFTSWGKSQSRAAAHAKYISREGKENGDLPVELEDGTVLREAKEVEIVLDSWFARQGQQKKNQRHTANIVLSSPKGSDPETVRNAARSFAGDYFGNHEYMFVLHTDTENPHVHLTVKARDFDGKQLHVNKADLKAAREVYEVHLAEQGIETNVSYRSERGKHMRPLSREYAQMAKRGVKPDNEIERERKAATSALRPEQPEPWKDAMARTDAKTVAESIAAARALEAQETYPGEHAEDIERLKVFAAGIHRAEITTRNDLVRAKPGAGEFDKQDREDEIER